MENNRITLKFEMTDRFGNHFAQESSVEIFDEVLNELDCIGEYFDNFLSQAGYYRSEDYIFMESVSEDELCALSEFLADYRANRKAQGGKCG